MLPAGKFRMGDDHGYDNEKPVHQITPAYEFAIGKYPVTFAEYDEFCGVIGRGKPVDRA